ncbi:DUF6538 domain-containing protein [Aureimonas psammosilenae]|uniref:DUF6538 domain-containing protein n=1 Tax=Aureimonas psammosilenae TaxID=2495496 RepID=UPI00126096D3|nr:DUF6538 domain-containing protein [Aureimonas psammosilenae]
MALRMAQPWPHPKTGVFWFRRAVPNDLRALVGKREELITLATKDAAEARVRYAKASAEVESRWANLRAGERSLTERECHTLAVAAHDAWLRMHGEEPSEQFTWHLGLYRRLWTKGLSDGLPGDGKTLAPDDLFVQTMQRFCFVQADNCLAHHGLKVDSYSRIKLAKAIGAAFQRASLTLADLSQGRLTPEEVPALAGEVAANPLRITDTRAASSSKRSASASKKASALTMTGLFEAWWREAQAAGRKPSTHESYQNTVKGFVAFLKHDDAARITADDVVAFKDHRLSTPSKRTGKIPSAKTVKDSDLSALKTLFSWAVMNRKLPVNPATGLTIKVGKKAQVRPKGFIEVEAHAILSAALAYQAGPREQACTAAAKRWIPWLCAFSGARVGEIGQMRRQDVRQEGEFWVMRITPEAGTVKTNQARDVVLHPQLIELGFPDFVKASANGPLFLIPAEDGDVLGPLAGLLNRMREFVRPIVPDPMVAPNHGWRHLFTTMCIDAEIEARVYNAIQGHAGRSVADHYGDVTLRAKAAAIGKLPRFAI